MKPNWVSFAELQVKNHCEQTTDQASVSGDASVAVKSREREGNHKITKSKQTPIVNTINKSTAVTCGIYN